MNWITLKSEDELFEIIEKSNAKPQVIFKHSTRCSISSMAKNRLEKKAFPDEADFYYLDLIAHRSLSNKIADEFNVMHESPQILIIKNGNCIYDESHGAITIDEIIDQLSLS